MFIGIFILCILLYITISFYIGLIEASNKTYKYHKLFFPSKIIINFFKSIC